MVYRGTLSIDEINPGIIVPNPVIICLSGKVAIITGY
jgi:hypothetical protein